MGKSSKISKLNYKKLITKGIVATVSIYFTAYFFGEMKGAAPSVFDYINNKEAFESVFMTDGKTLMVNNSIENDIIKLVRRYGIQTFQVSHPLTIPKSMYFIFSTWPSHQNNTSYYFFALKSNNTLSDCMYIAEEGMVSLVLCD